MKKLAHRALVTAALLLLSAQPFYSQAERLPLPALQVAVDDFRDPVAPGEDLSYVLHIRNISTSPLNDVVLDTRTPPGTTFVSVSSAEGSFTTPQVGSDGEIHGTIGTISANTYVSVVLVFAPTSALAGETVFEASVTSADAVAAVVEPTFVALQGSRVLRWGTSEFGPGGVFAPPRYTVIERTLPKPPFGQPIIPEAYLAPLSYRVYRSDSSPVVVDQQNLFGTFPSSQLNTGALTIPGFYSVTALLNGTETKLSNEVSLDKGEPLISHVITSKKLTIVGSDFEPGAVVTLDGLGFRKDASVESGGTQLVQGGKLENGIKLKKYLFTHRTPVVCVRNPSGGVSCTPIGLLIVPGP